MATFIDASLGTRLLLSANWTPPAGDFRIEIRFIITSATAGTYGVMDRASDLFYTQVKFGTADDYNGRNLASLTFNGEGAGSQSSAAGTMSLNDGEVHEVIITRSGTTHRFYIDGAEIGENNPGFNAEWPITYANNASSFNRLTDQNPVQFEYIKWYGSSDQSNLVRSWEAAASDTTNTGAQPVLVDTVAGDNAVGEGYPTDGSAFIVTTTSPAITLSAAPQLGATLSGTGSNYAAQPTGPISITQGARSLPDMPITVSAWDAGTGSFNWTTNAALPGLPANGADTTPFVLTGEDVTITLPDPGA